MARCSAALHHSLHALESSWNIPPAQCLPTPPTAPPTPPHLSTHPPILRTLRLPQRNGHHDHESYNGDRTKEALVKFADELASAVGPFTTCLGGVLALAGAELLEFCFEFERPCLRCQGGGGRAGAPCVSALGGGPGRLG